MAGITLEQAEARLAAWMAADEAVSKGQAYELEGRSFTRVDSATIRDNIHYWESRVMQLSAGGGLPRRGPRVRYGVAGE